MVNLVSFDHGRHGIARKIFNVSISFEGSYSAPMASMVHPVRGYMSRLVGHKVPRQGCHAIRLRRFVCPWSGPPGMPRDLDRPFSATPPSSRKWGPLLEQGTEIPSDGQAARSRTAPQLPLSRLEAHESALPNRVARPPSFFSCRMASATRNIAYS